MLIRPGTPADIPALAELWLHSFTGERSISDRLHTLESGGRHGGIETVLLAEAGGRVAGACRLIPYRQVLAGSEIPMLGLAAVAVAPWARRGGVASELCRRALGEGVGRGDVVSLLYPFRPEFYRRLGWGLVGELHSYRFRPESLREGIDPEVDLGGPADVSAVAACYDRVARESNGLLVRDEAMWRARIEAPATHVFLARWGGAVRGYLLARYGRSRAAETRTLHVRELVAEDEAAYRRLLGWISRQRDVWPRVRYDAAPDENFAHRLTEPRPPGYRSARRLWAESARLIRGPMLRILDVRAAFERRLQWGAGPAFTFDLEVADAEVPANRGPHRFEFDGGRVRTVDGLRAPTSLRVTAPALAQIYAGELAVRTAIGMGLASGEGDVAALDALLTCRRAFRILDEF